MFLEISEALRSGFEKGAREAFERLIRRGK